MHAGKTGVPLILSVGHDRTHRDAAEVGPATCSAVGFSAGPTAVAVNGPGTGRYVARFGCAPGGCSTRRMSPWTNSKSDVPATRVQSGRPPSPLRRPVRRTERARCPSPRALGRWAVAHPERQVEFSSSARGPWRRRSAPSAAVERRVDILGRRKPEGHRQNTTATRESSSCPRSPTNGAWS